MNFHQDEVKLTNVNTIGVSKMFIFKQYISNLIGKISSRLMLLGQNYLDNEKRVALLNDAMKTKKADLDIDYYDEQHEIDVWKKYHAVLTGKLNHPHTIFHHELFRDLVRALICSQNNKSIVNFGVSCAYSDALLAGEHPNTKFYGVDRSKVTKELNEENYAKENISFYNMDICDFLKKYGDEISNGILVHQRVGAVLYPEKLRMLYKACYENNINTILCLEPIGYSRPMQEFYKFSFEPKDSIVFRAPLLMHNYPNLLKEAGYRCDVVDALSYQHPHEDIKILEIVATRVQN